MKILNKFIWSKTEPKNKNDVWFDGSVFNLYRNDTWEAFTLPVDAAEKVAEVIKNALNVFQSKLTAGKGISIKDDVISTTSLFKVVNVLPEIGEEDVIYLVYTESSDIENKLVEYIWVEKHFEKLGEFKADIDLSEYAKKEALDKLSEEIVKKQNALVSGENIKTINGQPILGGGNIEIKGGEGSYDDTELREAIKRLEDDKANATDVKNELTKKVDKVKGKGLSSNDYTTEEKNKLASLQNYDESALRNEIAQKASTEGYYPKMEVGKADNLPDRVDVTEGAITFRESAGEGNSIEDGTCEVKELCGNTLVWNQKINNKLSTNNTGLDGWYVRQGQNNAIINNDGSITINFNSGISSVPQISQRVGFTPTHKYYLKCEYDYNSELINENKDLWLAILQSLDLSGTNTQTLIGNLNNRTETKGVLEIIKEIDSEYPYIITKFYNLKSNYNDLGYSAKFRINICDLTQMFEAGNEPSTIEEFYKRIPVGVDLYAYNEGEIVNVNINGIKSVNDNAWDEEWEVGSINAEGELVTSTTNIRSKNFCKCLPNASYAISSSVPANKVSIFWYDKNKSFLERVYIKQIGMVFNSPLNAAYFMVRYDATLVYENNICIRLAHSGYKTDYVPHEEDTMPLDLAKYFPNGMNGVNGVSDSLSMNEKVQRIGEREYQSGDESNADVMTDGVKTLYVLAEPIVEEIYPPLNLSYKVWDFGTEEILTDGASAPLITKAIYGFNATDTIRGNKAKIAQNTEEIVKLRNEIAQAIGNVINGEY